MLTLKNSLEDDGLLCFLKRNPSLSTSLLADCAQDIQEVTTIIKPVLQASQRCQNAAFFIQAVSLGSTGFLATNLATPKQNGISATEMASSWSLGRSATCALRMKVKSISRCHAVITHHPTMGFLVTDLGSKNGTRVNGSKVKAHTRYPINDGDLLQFGTLVVELFVSHRPNDMPQWMSPVNCMATSPA